MAAHGQETAHHAAADEGLGGGGGFAGDLAGAVVEMAVAPVEHFVAEDMGKLLIEDGVQKTAVGMAESITSLGDPVEGSGSVPSGDSGGHGHG